MRRSVLSYCLLGVLVALAGCRTRLPRAPAATEPSASSGDREAPPDPALAVATAAGLAPELLEPRPWTIHGHAYGLVIPDARFGGGSLRTALGALRLEARKNLGLGAQLSLDLVYERSDYDFGGGGTPFPPGTDPIGGLDSLGLRGRIIQPFHPEWAVFLFASTAAEAEEGADLRDGASHAVTLGVGHLFKNGLQLGVGPGLIWRPEEALIVIPAVQFDWELNDCWSLSLDGAEFEAKRTISSRLALGLALGFRSTRARLDDSAPTNAGLFTDSRLPLQLRGYFTPRKNLEIELRLGVDLYRELFFEDGAGTLLDSERLRPVPHVGLRVRYDF